MNHQFIRYQQEADAITKEKQTPEKRARLQFLLSAMSVMKNEFPAIEARGTGNEDRSASLRFRDAILGETRTYSPMSTSADAQIIPGDFEPRLIQLSLAAGPLFSGSPVLTNIERNAMHPLKVPVCTDLSAGILQAENTTATEQELTFGSVILGKNQFSSGILLASSSLCEDVAGWTTAEALIQRAAAGRLSRIQNSTFLPQLVTALAANSTGSVNSLNAGLIAAGDISALVSSVNGQYRASSSAGFLLNSQTAKLIYNLESSGGQRFFKHVLDSKPTLLGYPVFISDYADNVATAANPVIFGDWSMMTCRHVPGFELSVLNERFILEGFKGFILRKRSDIKYSVPSTSESALKMLTIA